jgi:hypothetical protein
MSHFGRELRRIGVFRNIDKLARLLEPFSEQPRFFILIALGGRWSGHDCDLNRDWGRTTNPDAVI